MCLRDGVVGLNFFIDGISGLQGDNRLLSDDPVLSATRSPYDINREDLDLMGFSNSLFYFALVRVFRHVEDEFILSLKTLSFFGDAGIPHEIIRSHGSVHQLPRPHPSQEECSYNASDRKRSENADPSF